MTQAEVSTADLLLGAFCRKFEQLYGSEHCTPNMHLHLHLKNCILDHGPAHSFWCFSFERYIWIVGFLSHQSKKYRNSNNAKVYWQPDAA